MAKSNDTFPAFIVIIAVWLAFNAVPTVIGVMESGRDRSWFTKRANDCHTFGQYRYDYIMPGFVFGCWLGQKTDAK